MDVSRIFIGGWFQRTTLHLSEVYDFLRAKPTPLPLDAGRLRAFREHLQAGGLEFHTEDFEYIVFESPGGIQTKIYEDGLIVLSIDPHDSMKKGIDTLSDYYDNKLSPALSYLYSLGAPVPKELANIKTIYPYFVLLSNAESEDIKNVFAELDEKEHSHVKTKSFTMYRGETLYVVNNLTEKSENIERLIEEQIFLREFKAQLHQYLNLHRRIWDRIANVKERGVVKGYEVDPLRKAVEGYAKTINLIEARISQMNAYISTRESIFMSKKTLAPYAEVLEYEYETLIDTHRYIKDLWVMTRNYVKSALHHLNDLQEKTTQISIKNLTVVSLLTAGGALISLLSRQELSLTYIGLAHVLVIAAFVYAANTVIRVYYRNYAFKFDEAETIKEIEGS